MRVVGVLALDGVQSLDLIGPLEVFAVANHLAGTPCYEVRLLSLSGAPIRSHAGLEIGPVLGLRDAGRLDTLVVAGGGQEEMIRAIGGALLLPWLHRLVAQTRRIASVCTGAFVLAAAGLLDGRRATTHWRNCADLQAWFPKIRVEPDAIFVADGVIYTSAGVTAGIDLCLALVEEDQGSDLARAVARELVLFLRRPGGQSQFSAGQDLAAKAPPKLQALVAALLADPAGGFLQGDLSVPALAAHVGMSARTFARRFQREIGISPGQFVQEARLGRVKALLETSGLSLDQIAAAAGFQSMDVLFALFQRKLGITPGDYRARFGPARGRVI